MSSSSSCFFDLLVAVVAAVALHGRCGAAFVFARLVVNFYWKAETLVASVDKEQCTFAVAVVCKIVGRVVAAGGIVGGTFAVLVACRIVGRVVAAGGIVGCTDWRCFVGLMENNCCCCCCCCSIGDNIDSVVLVAVDCAKLLCSNHCWILNRPGPLCCGWL